MKQYPHQSQTSNYTQGSNRLDYILLSQNMGQPKRIGYNPFYSLYSSDHWAMFMDIEDRTPVEIILFALFNGTTLICHSDF